MIKTSNIPTFVVEDPQLGFSKFNNVCHPINGLPLIEEWCVPKWLKYYNIDYNTVEPKKSTPESWHVIGINFWYFQHDYLLSLNPEILDLLKKSQIRLLFFYREADNPQHIRQHLNDLCDRHGIDPGLTLIVSGNSSADLVPGCMHFWFFDVNYFFQTLNSPQLSITKSKSKNITCLSRTHKNWREWFVYNIAKKTCVEKNYISYGIVSNLDYSQNNDFELWGESNRPDSLLAPDDAWRRSLPLTVDQLDQQQHNDHSIVVPEHYQDSYWNICLETLLDADQTTGIFVTEKTLKPIRNGQSFLVLGCCYTLALLREQGYQTFGSVIDENYDGLQDIRQRWMAIYNIALDLSRQNQSTLERMHERCLPMIYHNQKHFLRSRRPALEKFLQRLTEYPHSV